MASFASKAIGSIRSFLQFFESGEYAHNFEIETHRHHHVKKIHTESHTITRELVSLE